VVEYKLFIVKLEKLLILVIVFFKNWFYSNYMIKNTNDKLELNYEKLF